MCINLNEINCGEKCVYSIETIIFFGLFVYIQKRKENVGKNFSVFRKRFIILYTEI